MGLQDARREKNGDPGEDGGKKQIKEGLESPAHFQVQVNMPDAG